MVFHPAVKVNFDTSFSPSSLVGLGLVAQDCYGLAMATATSFSVEALSVIVAWALGFRLALSLAHDVCFCMVCYETD